MKISDIRTKDIVRLCNLNDDDLAKIKDLIRRYLRGSGSNLEIVWNYVKDKMLENDLTVDELKKTKKTKTEFAILHLNSPPAQYIKFPIQTRYLKLVERKPKHPVTRIFV